jgi:large subunit ribosomal protein LP0
MVREDKAAWKSKYFLNLLRCLEEYPKCFIVGVDNVGSKQMQEIRYALRGSGEILMGKNTMIRKAIRGHMAKNPALEKLLPYIVGNVGFVFTGGDLIEMRDMLLANKKEAPAKAGSIAPIDVKLPPQNTGMGPEKTSFFQALSIPTKISRGTIEILSEIHLVKLDEKVGASEATLLQMMNIRPFQYGLVVLHVYDSGTLFDPAVLDITPDDLRSKFRAGVSQLASVCLAIKYPCMASAPHMLAGGLKNLFAVAAVTDVQFKEADNLKKYLADPSAFAVAAAPAAASKAGEATVKKEVAKKEESEEEEEDMGFGLFD